MQASTHPRTYTHPHLPGGELLAPYSLSILHLVGPSQESQGRRGGGGKGFFGWSQQKPKKGGLEASRLRNILYLVQDIQLRR